MSPVSTPEPEGRQPRKRRPQRRANPARTRDTSSRQPARPPRHSSSSTTTRHLWSTTPIPPSPPGETGDGVTRAGLRPPTSDLQCAVVPPMALVNALQPGLTLAPHPACKAHRARIEPLRGFSG